MAKPRQSYDPYKLIDEVADLLHSQGLEAATLEGRGGEALSGASQLLRSLGVEPLMDSVESSARSSSRVWSEGDGEAPVR